MVFVADLYDTMRDQWGFDVEETQEYLDAAIALLDFEDTMPLYTYFFPSKCKVAWGTGALLRVLLKYGLGSQEQLDQLYRANKRVFVYTFLGSQLPDGSWPPVNYPGGRRCTGVAVRLSRFEGVDPEFTGGDQGKYNQFFPAGSGDHRRVSGGNRQHGRRGKRLAGVLPTKIARLGQTEEPRATLPSPVELDEVLPNFRTGG